MLPCPFANTSRVRDLHNVSLLFFSYKRCPLDGAQKAGQIFLPVLENASKAQNLRVTLGIFEKSKFFFNLPTFIIESIEAVGSPFISIEV